MQSFWPDRLLFISWFFSFRSTKENDKGFFFDTPLWMQSRSLYCFCHKNAYDYLVLLYVPALCYHHLQIAQQKEENKNQIGILYLICLNFTAQISWLFHISINCFFLYAVRTLCIFITPFKLTMLVLFIQHLSSDIFESFFLFVFFGSVG